MIHVSIHDVSPRWAHEVETALAMCAEIGVRPGLLVVPDFHHQHALDARPDFVAHLRELAGRGHELLLHGYYHLAGSGSGLQHVVTQRVMSAGEAEFAGYDQLRGEAMLDRGLAMLRELQLPISGFVPPAWTRRRWLLPALAARGIPYCEDQLFVYRPGTSRTHGRRLCPALNYASRTLDRRLSSMAYARVGRLYPRVGLGVRIALHPADLGHRVLVDETRRLLAWARGRTTDVVQDLFVRA